MTRPMLDDLELQQVQTITLDGDQVWVQHAVPALEGDFLQGLGRRASQITLTGVLTGAEVADELQNLRAKFHAAHPVSFVADIATATRIDQMLIEEMGVRELAGKPGRFEYAFTLREYSEAQGPGRETPPTEPPEIEPEIATLIVQVVVEGEPAFDHSQTVVEVTGTKAEGGTERRTLGNRVDDTWTETPFPPGTYTVTATTAGPDSLSKSEAAVLKTGETLTVVIRLKRNNKVDLARMLMVHYRFDNSFIEPCLRPVLRQAAEYAAAHPGEKLLILGHTDLVGPPVYNQSLSERRARGVYAYLTFGVDADTAVAEWNELRKARTIGQARSVNDTWGVREYKHMLQALRYYAGAINEQHTTATDAAVRAFQSDNNLTVDGIVGNQTWPVLIRHYLSLDSLAVPPSQFLPNARNGCDGGPLRWLGAGEMDPFRDTENAWRPNRRTELLFVPDEVSNPAVSIPRPDTFDLPALTIPQWCLGGSGGGPRACFVTNHPQVTPKEVCTVPPESRWQRQPLEPQRLLVSGSVRYEDGRPAGQVDFVLTAADGEYLNPELPGAGERNNGLPILSRTDENGRFSYPLETPAGVYSLELPNLPDPQVVRLADAPATSATGKTVCQRLDGRSEFNVVITLPGMAAANLQFVLAEDVEATINSVSPGEHVRLRADLPGATGNEVLVEIASFL